jgi:membrane-bound ClpP family serine protease
MENLELAYVLIGLGLIFLAGEMIVPTGGMLFVPAAGLCVAGTALTFFYGDPKTGIATLVGVFIILPIVVSLLLKFFPYSPFGSKLPPPEEGQSGTVGDMPGVQSLEQFTGRVGKSLSALRPSGVVEFDGRRVDCVSEGMMIEAGTWVRCMAVKTGKVIVRQIDKPDVKTFDSEDFS